MDLEDYQSTREALSSEVRSALHELLPTAQIIGSWLHDEFHFGKDSRTIISDVDAFDPTIDLHRATRLHLNSLSRYIRLSVHTHDYTRTMSLKAQKVSALINLSTSLFQPNLAIQRYGSIKTLLVLHRIDHETRYAETASRLNKEGDGWYQEKLGLIEKSGQRPDDSCLDTAGLEDDLMIAYRTITGRDPDLTTIKITLDRALKFDGVQLSKPMRDYLESKITRLRDTRR